MITDFLLYNFLLSTIYPFLGQGQNYVRQKEKATDYQQI